ncbi:MAG: aminotransferase class V-fold PLP-dependent enzyme [Acidimicrobiia bacterium]|nr:aminotransferase class V-fold PLP-dependent enzyme [Acidimicrobiia bacterium]
MVDLIETIRDSVIGTEHAVPGPFGPRRVTYADYTASGRSLAFIEEYIQDVVLPLYANTHTESSGTGLQTSKFREEAREIIRRCVNGNDDHAVVFVGSGCTGAIDRIIRVLGLSIPDRLESEYHLSTLIPADERPVVFIGPFEHHSNELPWRESIADVIKIGEDTDGHIDQEQLEAELIKYEHRPLKIGSFSAASNVTGIISDTAGIAQLLHRYGALSFWDFAAAAPYVAIDMVIEDQPGAHKDAIFISTHKLIGGPGTPGLLIARKELFQNAVPGIPGGGTVTFVNPDDHEYIADIEHREEGGTPAIVESIRAGLVFQLKEAVGTSRIRDLEHGLIRRAIDSWKKNPNIEILGNHDADRLSIVSFVVRHKGQYLHHNFIVALLNDLFGIQSRGGCSCAGPYGHALLGIDMERSRHLSDEVALGCEGIKPGWIRVNFNYFFSDAVMEFIIDAVNIVATDGWKLLPWYAFDVNTAGWTHVDGRGESAISLTDIRYETGTMEYDIKPQIVPERELTEYLAHARTLFATIDPATGPVHDEVNATASFEDLRWFLLPNEVRASHDHANQDPLHQVEALD